MLLAEDLHINVLVVVAVHGRDGVGVADPQVDGLGLSLQCYPCKRYVLVDVCKDGCILMSQVVVFCQ